MLGKKVWTVSGVPGAVRSLCRGDCTLMIPLTGVSFKSQIVLRFPNLFFAPKNHHPEAGEGSVLPFGDELKPVLVPISRPRRGRCLHRPLQGGGGDGSFGSAAHKLLCACPRQAGIRRFAALCNTLRMTVSKYVALELRPMWASAPTGRRGERILRLRFTPLRMTVSKYGGAADFNHPRRGYHNFAF